MQPRVAWLDRSLKDEGIYMNSVDTVSYRM